MARDKTRLERLNEATPEEMLEELARRRRETLRDCSDQEIEMELAARGLDRGFPVDDPPKRVEK